jgi:hypothetical protein
MSNSLKNRPSYASVLAASIVIFAAAAPVSSCFARGSGGGHASMAHAAPGAMFSHGMPRAPSHIRLPAQPSTHPNGGHGQNSHEHHHHHMPPPSTGTTSPPPTTTTVVTTTPASSTSASSSSDSSSAAAASEQSSSPSTSVTSQQTQPADTSVSTGGTLATDHSGGGGDTLAACMSFWKADTTMTRVEWRDTCVRTLNGLDIGGGVTDNIGTTASQTHHRKSAASAHRTVAQHREAE